MSDIVNQARYKRELDELKEKVKINTEKQSEYGIVESVPYPARRC